MQLWKIHQELMNAWDRAIDAETGEIKDEEALGYIDALEIERDEKIENIALWIKDLNAEAEAIKKEKMALASRQASAERKAESLKRYLANTLVGDKFKTPKVAISYRKSEEVVFEGDVFKLDPLFLTFKDPTPNKKAIKDALKQGKELEGCTLVEKQNIQIR